MPRSSIHSLKIRMMSHQYTSVINMNRSHFPNVFSKCQIDYPVTLVIVIIIYIIEKENFKHRYSSRSTTTQNIPNQKETNFLILSW